MESTNFAALLEKAINEPGTISKAYTAFYGYSIGNQLLAMGQCMARDIPIGPIATFMGWKDKGRFVKKGEKAIELCMPVTCKAKRETADGEEQSATFTRFVFRRNWFVMSQTDGQAAEALNVPEWNATRALAALNITEVAFEYPDGNCQGYAKQRSIAVSPVAELPHKTRFHEIAHVVLGHTTEADTLSDSDLTPRSLREVEAEAVAYICIEALELPGAEFSRGYLQHWNNGSDPIPEKSAQKIMKAANEILKAGRDDKEKGVNASE